MAILIKRYANRKLYNTETSRYITLKGIAELLDAGDEVQVIDNESGEDITSVALSQILVDRKRSNTSPPDTLLSQIIGKGGDVLYGALRKGMDDASGGIEDLQERVRRIVTHDDAESSNGGPNDSSRNGAAGASGETGSEGDRPGLGHWINHASPDLDQLVQGAVERVFRLLDLPRRSDVEALNENLERVAAAVETLEKAFADRSHAPNEDDSGRQ